MAVSDVSICNLALQKLGAKRITSLTEDSNNARQCNACYESVRDQELRKRNWKFAITRATLTPLADAPAFDFSYAFPVPSDCLRLILPTRSCLDWTLETQDDTTVILTNDGNSINVRYIARITDPTRFDPLFVEALACRIAEQVCEQVTQSNEKKADAQQQYKDAIAGAALVNAFEKLATDAPPSSWETARLVFRTTGGWSG